MKKSLFFLLLILQPFFLTLEAQNTQKIKFHRLLAGISNNHVGAILQDRAGFMWFGTANGLCKFDGYNYTIYDYNPLDSNSISPNLIYKILEDHKGGLWIASEGGGLYYLDRKQEKLRRFKVGKGKKNISSSIARDILEDNEHLIWIAMKNGLNCYNPSTDQFTHYLINQSGVNSQYNNIFSLVEDSQENLWLAGQGIFKFDKKNKKFIHFNVSNSPIKDNYIRALIPSRQKNKFWIGYGLQGLALASFTNNQIVIEKHYSPDSKKPQSIAGKTILSLCEDNQSKLWIGIENEGISILDPSSDTFTHFSHNMQDEESLANNSPWQIYEDRWGNMWVGTYNQGVNVVYNGYYEKFIHYGQKSTEANTLVNNNVSSFLEDKNGKIWIGTDGGGVSCLDLQSGQFVNYTREKNTPYQLTSNAVLALFEDNNQNIWMGTWEGGINIYNIDNQKFKVLTKNDKLSSNSYRSMTKTKDKLLVASWPNLIDVFDLKTQQLLWTKNLSEFNHYTVIFADSKGNIWIGGDEGLGLIKSENFGIEGVVEVFKHNPKSSTSLSDNFVTSICEDKNGNIWIGTIAGLNKYNPQKNNFTVLKKTDGLVNDYVKAIIEDNLGSLWITTAKGLSKFDPQTKKFDNFSKEDGLQGDEFTDKAIYCTRNGNILVGGTNGFNLFRPSKLLKNPHPPLVYLKGFKLFNKPVAIGAKDSPLKQSITYTQKITLSHLQSVFTIEYVALNYIRPEKNQYAYILDGFEKEWNFVGNKYEATYTSLPTGEYTFKVKATNNDGIWSKETISLTIIVLPPWWETWWFRTLAISLIVLTTILGVRWRINAIKAQKIYLEKLVQKRTLELKEKNDEVLQQSEELHQQAEELTSQRDYIQGQNMLLAEQNKIMEEKSRQIRQSINAAQTIQQAILPHQEKLNRLLGDSFVLYQPKDVVSGDFYWLSQIDNQTILVVADCTGHGVPGAFMTLIGNSILDKLVKVLKITNPAEILTQLHYEVFDKLKQGFSGNNNGMDAVVLNLTTLENARKKIIFAGAKNSFFYVEEGNIQELKGNRRAIGGSQNENIPFENQEVILSKNSMIYVGSDGYIDQNNAKRKKFGHERFLNLLAENASLPLTEQKIVFQKNLESYSEGTFQRDDVLLIGIRV